MIQNILGKNHPNFVAALTPKLLDLHPFFDTREIDISDANYAAKMIMILNAAHKCPSVGQFFPPFVSRHYSYLRDVYPKLVPLLTFMEVGSAQSSRDETSEGRHLMDSRPTIEYLLNRVKDIKSSPSGIKSGWFFNIKFLSIRQLRTILKDSLQPFLFLRCS